MKKIRVSQLDLDAFARLDHQAPARASEYLWQAGGGGGTAGITAKQDQPPVLHLGGGHTVGIVARARSAARHA